jgi:asparagine synthase (glutamine-hydrolysing)
MPWKWRSDVQAESWGYPEWLNPDFEKRNDLQLRWEEQVWESPWKGGGPRAAAYRNMTLPRWGRLFEIHDAGVAGVPLDDRHPLLDLRLLRFLLSLPVVPWCIDKHVMRKAAVGVLPRRIIGRPKTGLRGDPIRVLASSFLSSLPDQICANARLEQFLELRRLKNVLERSEPELYWLNIRPTILNRWLNSCTRGR